MIAILFIVICFLYLLFGFLLIWGAVKLFRTLSGKVVVACIGIVLWLLIPTWDEILAALTMDKLCGAASRITVYQTLSLPSKYWREDGSPQFYDMKNGNFHLARVKVNSEIRSIASIFAIQELNFYYFDKEQQKTLAKVTSYSFQGGWFARALSPLSNGYSCKENGIEFYTRAILSTFKPM